MNVLQYCNFQVVLQTVSLSVHIPLVFMRVIFKLTPHDIKQAQTTCSNVKDILEFKNKYVPVTSKMGQCHSVLS